MREGIRATHHYDHQKIAIATGMELDSVRQIAVKLGDILNPYRVSGDKGVYLYNQSGFLVWEHIAQLRRQGQTPKSIKNHLRKTIKTGGENHQSSQNLDLPRDWVEDAQAPKKRVGEEVVPRHIYEDTRLDFQARIKDQGDEITYLRGQVKELQAQTRLLPAPEEFRRQQEKVIQARHDAHRLIQELKELQNNEYGIFQRKAKEGDRKRIEELLRELDELNLKH